MRTDLIVTWPYDGDKKQIIIVELKIKRGSPEAVKQQGAGQILKYMDRCGAGEGYLIVFDKTTGKSWEEKLFQEVVEIDGKHIPVWGM